MPKLNEILFGKKSKVKKAKTLNEGQEELMNLINEGIKSGKGPLADLFGGFNQEQFEQGVSQPAIKNFQENILPLLQEKFIANNQVLGSNFQKAKLKAGTDLQSKLAELMYQAQQGQKQNQLAGIQTSLGTKSFENLYRPANEGLFQGAAKAFAGGLGQAGGQGIAGSNAVAPTGPAPKL